MFFIYMFYHVTLLVMTADALYHRLIEGKEKFGLLQKPEIPAAPFQEPSRESSSPLHFLQSNILDKLVGPLHKQTKPVENLSSALERLNSVDSTESAEHEIDVRGGVIHQSDSTKLSHDNDPLPVIKKVEKYKEELPPVIKLESPDLLTVEIFTGASSSENVTSPKAERFNPFDKDDNSESSSVRGSTDYEREVSCDSSMRSWADLSYVTEERLKKIKIEDNDKDDIVFSAKPKKHKKKRKGMYG